MCSLHASNVNVVWAANCCACRLLYSKLVVEQKLSYTEVPVQVMYHEYGQGLVGGIKIVGDMLLHILTKK